MEFEEYKKGRVEHLRESIRLFSNKGKKERERWIAKKFLNVLGVSYTAGELRQPREEPPDVIFRAAHFEITELYDEDRKRHDEYRNKLKKIEAARNYSEIGEVVSWDLEPKSLSELLVLAEERLEMKKGHYSPYTKAHLDVLIYVNLEKISIDDEDYVFTDPIPERSSLRNWRSASLVFNRDIVCGVQALISAPAFIRAIAGKVTRKL
jgi:hypothetical protein